VTKEKLEKFYKLTSWGGRALRALHAWLKGRRTNSVSIKREKRQKIPVSTWRSMSAGIGIYGSPKRTYEPAAIGVGPGQKRKKKGTGVREASHTVSAGGRKQRRGDSIIKAVILRSPTCSW